MRDSYINLLQSQEDQGYTADIPDLVACSAFGATPKKALREVELARAAWIGADKAEGRQIPALTRRAMASISD